jgi:hypothetical protein
LNVGDIVGNDFAQPLKNGLKNLIGFLGEDVFGILGLDLEEGEGYFVSAEFLNFLPCPLEVINACFDIIYFKVDYVGPEKI